MFEGSRIKEQREVLGISQETLAEKINVHVNTIRRWERGKQVPDALKLNSLAKALNTTTMYLLGETSESTLDKPADESIPYTQAQTVNRGMLIYDLGNGKKIELPPTKDSYDFLREIASRATHVAVL